MVGINNPKQACLVIENKINDSINPKVDFLLEVTIALTSYNFNTQI